MEITTCHIFVKSDNFAKIKGIKEMERRDVMQVVFGLQDTLAKATAASTAKSWKKVLIAHLWHVL